MIFKKFFQRKNEILGLNRRNQVYLRQLNTPAGKHIADSKLETKRILAKIGVPTPELYKVVRVPEQIEFIDWESLPKSFVIKPNQGSRGRGIFIVYGKRKNKLEWIRPNGSISTVHDHTLHIQNIMQGRFSLGSRKDIALIEELIKPDKTLKQYSYKGVPDIRLIIYNQIPIMAMIRLPTKKSNGTANLHSGAICAGIDIANGITTHAIQLKSKSILADQYESVEYTTDLKKNLPLRGLEIPYWDKILKMGVKCQIASKLGYVGVDIMLDQEKGPLIVELNARPGLGIQVANRAGLRVRLERVEGLKIKSINRSVRIAKNLFGGEVSEEIEQISGKQIVNLVEKIRIYHKPKTRMKRRRIKIKRKSQIIKVLLDTGILTSRIAKQIASQIGFIDAIKYFRKMNIPKSFETFKDAQDYIDEYSNKICKHPDIVRLAKISESGKIKVKPVLKVKIKISGIQKTIEAILSTREHLTYQLLIGRNELKEFLIDASKRF